IKPYLATRGFIAAMSTIVAVGVSGWIAIPRLLPMKAAQAALADKSHGGPLGDLAPFARITSDTLAPVQRGDLNAAKVRIKDLETAWDDAEKQMRPKSPSDWKSLDKSIDRALAQLRAKKPDAAGCEATLKALIAQIDSLQPASNVTSKFG